MNDLVNTFSEVNNLGRLIRGMREARGVSVNDLVRATGLSRSMISKFERGQTDIQLSSVIKIFSAMSLTLDDLCHARPFDEFLMNELCEKAYQFQNDHIVLKQILDEICSRDFLIRQEEILKLILQTLLNSNRGLPSEVENYFDNLDGIWSFDTYLSLLAEPFLTQRIHLRIAKELAQYQGYRPKIINTAYHVFVH
ncbi:MAG: helix-turn-helix domain-containing protein [Leuconostoc mesenteroides]